MRKCLPLVSSLERHGVVDCHVVQRAGVAEANRDSRCDASLALAGWYREYRRNGDLYGSLIVASLWVQVLRNNAGTTCLLHDHACGGSNLLHTAVIELDASVV